LPGLFFYSAEAVGRGIGDVAARGIGDVAALGAGSGDGAGVDRRPLGSGVSVTDGSGDGDGFTHGGVMICTIGWPGAGEGVAVAFGVASGITPLGNGVGQSCGKTNQCSTNPVVAAVFADFPKYVVGYFCISS
jgi:hypothetical protein